MLSCISKTDEKSVLENARNAVLKPGAHTAILVGRFRFRWMFSAKTISDRICRLIYIATFANIIHLNLNRPTKIAVCAPGLRVEKYEKFLGRMPPDVPPNQLHTTPHQSSCHQQPSDRPVSYVALSSNLIERITCDGSASCETN